MRGKPYKQDTGPSAPKIVTNAYVSEALARQASKRPAKTPPRAMPVTPDTSRYASDLLQLKGAPRAWILISHWEHSSGTHRIIDDRQPILTILDRMGKREATFQTTGAVVYLYDLAG